jgi:hypothetical protein
LKIIRPMTVNDAALADSNVPENDYPAYNAGTTYALGDLAIYVAADKHWIIESLQDDNTGHTPTGEASDTWWLKRGNTNRWKMFDQSVQSQTENADSIEVEIIAYGIASGLALLNVSAATANITVTDAIDGEVYNEDYNMTSDSGIQDWYAYFFEPIVRLSDLALTDLPSYAGATVSVTLTDTGNTAKCGALILGQFRELGDTQYGMSLGITDYSVKQQDDFGNYTILERAYRRRAELTLWVQNGFVDQLHTTLASFRAEPTVYIGADEFGASIIYGFYKDFDINVSFPTHSICNLQLEGLT